MLVRLSGILKPGDLVFDVIEKSLKDYYGHKSWNRPDIEKTYFEYEKLVEAGAPRWGEAGSADLSTQISKVTDLSKANTILILDMIKLMAERGQIRKEIYQITDQEVQPVYVSLLQKEKAEENFDFGDLLKNVGNKIKETGRDVTKGLGIPDLDDLTKKIKALGLLAAVGAGVYFFGIPILKKISKGR